MQNTNTPTARSFLGVRKINMPTKNNQRKATAGQLEQLDAKARITATDKDSRFELNTEAVKYFAEVWGKLTKGGRPPIASPSKKTLAQRKWREKLDK